MYGILADTDLSFLRGKTLTQVCFGPNDLQLHFADGTSISIESSVGYSASAGDFAKRIVGKEPGSISVLEDPLFLFALLMKDVEDVTWIKEGTATLTFDQGYRLQIYDDSQQHESYKHTIRRPTDRRLIFGHAMLYLYSGEKQYACNQAA